MGEKTPRKVARKRKDYMYCLRIALTDLFASVMPKSDERYSEPCMEGDKVSVCKQDLCCIQKTVPIQDSMAL